MKVRLTFLNFVHLTLLAAGLGSKTYVYIHTHTLDRKISFPWGAEGMLSKDVIPNLRWRVPGKP